MEQSWPNKVEEDLKAYFMRKGESSTEMGIIMWGFKMIISRELRKELLMEAHSTHIGIGKMKTACRCYF